MDAERRGGFSLVELMIASLLFAMVVAGLAAIYATVFKQAGRTLGDSIVKNQAAVAMRSLQMEMTQGSGIVTPAPGAASNHLRGCRNFRADTGAPIVSFYAGGGTVESGCFHFCVRPAAGGDSSVACEAPGQSPPTNRPAPCLYHYPSTAGGAWGVPGVNFSNLPAVDDGSCGQSRGGVIPRLLASGIEPVPGAAGYFSRDSGVVGGSTERGNTIRASFIVTREKTHAHPKLSYEVDSTLEFQFAPN